MHPVDFVLDLSLATDLKTRFRIPMLNYDEAEVEELLRDPNIVLGLGDGGAHLSQLNDARYPTLAPETRQRGLGNARIVRGVREGIRRGAASERVSRAARTRRARRR